MFFGRSSGGIVRVSRQDRQTPSGRSAGTIQLQAAAAVRCEHRRNRGAGARASAATDHRPSPAGAIAASVCVVGS